MLPINLFIKTLIQLPEDQELLVPKRATRFSSGYDVFAQTDIVLTKDKTVTFGLGYAMQFRLDLPFDIKPGDPDAEEDYDRLYDGIGCLIMPRSGLGFKKGTKFSNTIPLIDPDYKNEWFLSMYVEDNPSFPDEVVIPRGTAIAQLVFIETGVVQNLRIVKELPETGSDRVGGLGSTSTFK